MPIVGSAQGATRHLRRQFGDRAKVGAKGEGFTTDELAKLFERRDLDMGLPQPVVARVGVG